MQMILLVFRLKWFDQINLNTERNSKWVFFSSFKYCGAIFFEHKINGQLLNFDERWQRPIRQINAIKMVQNENNNNDESV